MREDRLISLLQGPQRAGRSERSLGTSAVQAGPHVVGHGRGRRTSRTVRISLLKGCLRR